MSLQAGDKVRTNCPRSPRFHQRKGTVVTGQYRGEVGVSFSADDNIDAYFLPSELTLTFSEQLYYLTRTWNSFRRNETLGRLTLSQNGVPLVVPEMI